MDLSCYQGTGQFGKACCCLLSTMAPPKRLELPILGRGRKSQSRVRHSAPGVSHIARGV